VGRYAENGAMLLLETRYLARKKIRRGPDSGFYCFAVFLRGVLEKVGGWRWFFDGENVVDWW
jgi:hypothetical protein